MLVKASEELRECLLHAEDCARRAKEVIDPLTRQDFLDLEQRWLSLARSYEFVERLNAFMGPLKK